MSGNLADMLPKLMAMLEEVEARRVAMPDLYLCTRATWIAWRNELKPFTTYHRIGRQRQRRIAGVRLMVIRDDHPGAPPFDRMFAVQLPALPPLAIRIEPEELLNRFPIRPRGVERR